MRNTFYRKSIMSRKYWPFATPSTTLCPLCHPDAWTPGRLDAWPAWTPGCPDTRYGRLVTWMAFTCAVSLRAVKVTLSAPSVTVVV